MSRGITLPEMLVSLLLGLLIVAGAFELHAAFHRQTARESQTVELEQALRVAAQVIGRALRSAGNGLEGGTLQIYNHQQNRNCPSDFTLTETSCYYPVQFSNHNRYAPGNLDENPAGASPYQDGLAGDGDLDPDWLRIVALADDVVTAGDSPRGLRVIAAEAYPLSRALSQALFFYTVRRFGATGACLRQAGSASVLPDGLLLEHPTGSLNPPSPDPCLLTDDLTPPGRLHRTDQSVLFRIATEGPNGPRLVASWTRPGAPPHWQTLSDLIEDLQIALLLEDGSLCNSVDAPALCDPLQVRAVRFTLVARSRPLASVPASYAIGPLEDRPRQSFDDHRQRRTLTEETGLRNSAIIRTGRP